MTFEEAIVEAENRSRNINLQWFVCKWNDDYIIHSSTHMRRFPDTPYLYSTGPLHRSWKVFFSESENRFKHIVKMENINLKEVASSFVEREKAFLAISNAVPAVITHKEKKFLGSVASIVPSDKEIVLMAHTSKEVSPELIEAILEISPDRLNLTVDNNLVLAERQDVLRLIGTNLTRMTPVQTKLASDTIKEKGIVEI